MKIFFAVSCEEYSRYDNICFCHADSISIREALVEYCDYDEYECETIMPYVGDEDDTADNIMEKIIEKCSRLQEDDVFVFFFAGHGMEVDNDVKLLLPGFDDQLNKMDAISLGAIRSVFSKSKGFCVSFVDACHSGKDVQSIDYNRYSARGMDRGWAILSACAGNEYSYPYTEKEQGAFSYFLKEAIIQWEPGTDITVEGIKNKVCDSMIEWCSEYNKDQHPTINGSIVGKQIIASRNNKKGKYEIMDAIDSTSVSIPKKADDNNLTSANSVSLWKANKGVDLPKNADIFCILENNYALNKKTIDSLILNYKSEVYESVAEIIWDKSIAVLRNRILCMGEEFVGEMIGIDNPGYIRDLPAFEVIELALELGFIDSTGCMRLKQSNELVRHFRELEISSKENDIDEEMTKNEIETIVRACTQYIIGYSDSQVSFEFSDYRNSLKRDIFSEDKLDVLQQSPYFYKRTTMRTLSNLLNSTNGAEYTNVASNFIYIIEKIWESLSSDDKYMIGTNYNNYMSNDDKVRARTYHTALSKVHGFDYVPENMRALTYIQTAKSLKTIHNELNNFYNEPEAARKLERLGTKIPRQAIKESIGACLLCLTGNPYGRSTNAVSILKDILKKLDTNDWIYYLNECFLYDGELLLNISSKDIRTEFWCELVKEFELNKLNVKDGKLKKMLEEAYSNDKYNVGAYTFAAYKKIFA